MPPADDAPAARHAALCGRHVLVTGAARGSGRVHCRRFADVGADVEWLPMDEDASGTADRGAALATVAERYTSTITFKPVSIADIATWPWVHVRWLHRIDLDAFPRVRRWYEAIAARPAVQRGIAVLADQMKIGNPDKQARASLFGRKQLARR